VSGKLYFYLPATSVAELVALSFDEELDGNEDYYGKNYTRGTSENTETLPYLQFATPSARIDYINKKLTGLSPDTNYYISIHTEELGGLSLSSETNSLTQQDSNITQQNGNTLSNVAGEIPIEDSWIGHDIDIVQTRIEIPYGDSDPQVLAIPDTPAAPDSSTTPLDLAATGLNLDLAYFLVAMLLFGTFLRKPVIPAEAGI
jgi:hypothetical protein